MASWSGLGHGACASACTLKARLCFHLLSATPSVTTPRENWGQEGSGS